MWHKNACFQKTLEKNKGAFKNGQSRDTGNIEHIRHRTKINKANNTTQKTKKMSNTDTIKNGGWSQVLTKGRQFLHLIRHHVPHIVKMCWTPLYVNKHKWHEPSYKQLEVKKNQTSFLCRNHSRHYNMELKINVILKEYLCAPSNKN